MSSLYTRIESSVVQNFIEEAGTGQAFVYAQYGDGSMRDVSARAALSSSVPSTLAVSQSSSGVFDIRVCQACRLLSAAFIQNSRMHSLHAYMRLYECDSSAA